MSAAKREKTAESPPERTLGPFRLNFNFFGALFFILFSAAILAAMPYQIEEPPLILGQPEAGLNPGLFPGVTLVILLLVGVWYLGASRRLEETNGFSEVAWAGFMRVAVTVAVLTGYAVTMEEIGFILSSCLVVGALTVFYGIRNPLVVLLSCVGIPVGIYFLFTRVLLVFLPEFELFDLNLLGS